MMRPFTLTAGSSEVNGTYTFAKQVKGISEYWFINTKMTIKQAESKKSQSSQPDTIYKIRGNGYLPQFGSDFNQCWILQTTQDDKTKQFILGGPIGGNLFHRLRYFDRKHIMEAG